MYDRSAKQYAAERQSLGDPDPFRFKYREEIKALIADLIIHAYAQVEANKMILERSLQLVQADQEKFIQTINNELISLYEGNFARYFVTPNQFRNWQKQWNSK